VIRDEVSPDPPAIIRSNEQTVRLLSVPRARATSYSRLAPSFLDLPSFSHALPLNCPSLGYLTRPERQPSTVVFPSPASSSLCPNLHLRRFYLLPPSSPIRSPPPPPPPPPPPEHRLMKIIKLVPLTGNFSKPYRRDRWNLRTVNLAGQPTGSLTSGAAPPLALASRIFTRRPGLKNGARSPMWKG